MTQAIESLTQFQNHLPQSNEFERIVLEGIPLIDVRAPVEFAQGAFEMAHNFPLMNDDERQQVGLCYKEKGHDEAVNLGHQLVNNQVRAPRVDGWQSFMEKHPDAMLYCFRGGMRSKIAQQWLADSGYEIVRLKGGYKAFRRYLIDRLEAMPQALLEAGIQPWVLGGRTGCGKTRLIYTLNNAIDLEGLANHRGSAFGRHVTPQPTQIDFENTLAMAMIRFQAQGYSSLVLEDEARNIGSLSIPKSLFDFFKGGRHAVLETPLAERIAITREEYVEQAQSEYPTFEAWAEFMRAAFERIRKRLGGERYQRVLSEFELACTTQLNQNTFDGHDGWIHILLNEYYDPMYDYQMQKHQSKIDFSGEFDAVQDFLRQQALSKN
ncbi:tRNA 2-selenouridine(34) synthase MnmH [Hydrogenovibrio sp. 3SP14C1]|uniref:tRNA 2-selenouridine(34) synthase MnmH n=1 Tax=Hydrogenovibrio sp. 3SP14C1 TaxID=3038774 RepID=UPI0024166814|nr:tRNA 2-selenouridine(34) synthase MnmH [Hydrogenovibrio sp. 3SP14C1]MDG4812480.1 tRNA 2-selenouridine(34) synthase MnmH [Hydrogenovibrio sp. 3SP14C1]